MIKDFKYNAEEYRTLRKAYEKGILTQKEWNDYCFDLLQVLMKKNHDVLDRLKNI